MVHLRLVIPEDSPSDLTRPVNHLLQQILEHLVLDPGYATLG